MHVLVTGGAGFIGSHVVEALLARGDSVVVLDNFNDYYDPAIKRSNAKALEAAGARVVEGDIRDQKLIPELFDAENFTAVIHLAAMAGVRSSLENPLLYSDVNVRGTQVLLEELKKREGLPMVFASSSSVYGGNTRTPFRESDDITKPISPYAATKRAGELLCYTHNHLYGNPITCLRFFTVYGPRQRPEMAIHKFVRLCLSGQSIPFFGDGTTRRDYTFVADIVDGVVRSLDRAAGFHIYNLGESQTISLAEMVQGIGRATGVEPVLDRQEMQPGDVLVTYADVSLATEELGYRPTTTLDEGLERFVAWYRAEFASTLSEAR